MAASRRSLSILSRAAEIRRAERRATLLAGKTNTLLDALRWTTAALVTAERKFTRLGQPVPKEISGAVDVGNAVLASIPDRRGPRKSLTP